MIRLLDIILEELEFASGSRMPVTLKRIQVTRSEPVSPSPSLTMMSTNLGALRDVRAFSVDFGDGEQRFTLIFARGCHQKLLPHSTPTSLWDFASPLRIIIMHPGLRPTTAWFEVNECLMTLQPLPVIELHYDKSWLEPLNSMLSVMQRAMPTIQITAFEHKKLLSGTPNACIINGSSCACA